MNDASIYESGNYLEENPTWHLEDSPWKAKQVLKMFQKHNLQLKTIAEVGCGVGEILNQLHSQLSDEIEFYGYEISPQAFDLAKGRSKPRLHYYLKDVLQEEVFYDMMLVMDVFEHVEDYLGFLERLRSTASQFVFHIPLDLSAQTVIRGSSLIHSRNTVGHLHYFTEETALATLEDSGYHVEDYFFTARGVELGGGLKRKVAKWPRRALAMINESWASRLLGGFSLLVLATPTSN